MNKLKYILKLVIVEIFLLGISIISVISGALLFRILNLSVEFAGSVVGLMAIACVATFLRSKSIDNLCKSQTKTIDKLFNFIAEDMKAHENNIQELSELITEDNKTHTEIISEKIEKINI